jgi:hypothetical protein
MERFALNGLIGNLVKVQNCPRNCKCGRNEIATVWWNGMRRLPYGKVQSRMKHESVDLPCLLVRFLIFGG